MPVLFFENYSKMYYTSYCSSSTFLCLVMIIFAVFLPLFIAYASADFWINISTYTEQPTVTFNNQFILNVLQGDDSYFYSSVLKLNDYYDNVLPVPLVKTESHDTNYDNKADSFRIKISFPSNPTEINNIKLMLFFNYTLTSRVKMIMQSMSLIDIDTPNGASYVYTNGHLSLSQKSPISSGTIAKTIYANDIFQNATSPYDFVSLYKVFNARNLTTPYVYEKLVMPFRSNRETEIEAEITIPSYQQVTYIPDIMFSLKFAWIQYLSILIPVVIVEYLILMFVFKYQIFETSVMSDLPIQKYK